MDDETNSQMSLEMTSMSVASSSESPPPPYSTTTSTTSFDDNDIDDAYSAAGSATTRSAASNVYYGLDDDFDYQNFIPAEIRKVTLERDTRGFGLTVAGGADSPYGILPVFVTSIDPNGVAADSGEVRLGDRIVSVNGKEMEGRPHRAVIEAIKQAGRRVTLELTEGPENIMNYLEFD